MNGSRPDEELSRWVTTYTRYGLYGLVAGIPLGLFAVFTNLIPDPSFHHHEELPDFNPGVGHCGSIIADDPHHPDEIADGVTVERMTVTWCIS